MKKSINSPKALKTLASSIVSALILASLAISPAAASVASSISNNENYSLLNVIEHNVDFAYMLAGMGTALLILFIYLRFPVPKKVVQKPEVYKEVTTKQLKLYITIPILFIALAELLIFFGQLDIAVWFHILALFFLSLSNILIRDPKVHKIHLPLMLLPLLRLVNLSMPVFTKMTLYTFVLYNTPLAIPIAAIIIHQRDSLADIGITKKHLLPYIIISVPLSFLLGLGEYLTIRPGYLIPDLSFENLLLLTVIMVFFVGLVEELIFRSLLQTRLEQALNIPEALLITSFLFGIMHSGYGTYYEMLYAGFVGLVIGLIFHKTRSLPFIAVLHGFVNVFLFGILPLHLIGWI